MWIRDLKIKASTCEFTDQGGLLMHDKLLFGVNDEIMNEHKVCEGDSLTLKKALSIRLWNLLSNSCVKARGKS